MYLGYPTKKALCKAHGVSYHRFIVRSKTHGIKESLEYAKPIGKREIVWRGISGLKEIAAANNVSFNRLRSALYDKHLTIEDAVTFAIDKDALVIDKTPRPQLDPVMRLALGLR